MIGTALRDGVRGWARAPIKAGFGTAVTLGLLVVAYALVIEVSHILSLTLLLWGLIANLVFAGWLLFCAGQVADQNAPWSALLEGFRRPLALTAAGLAAAGLVLLPTLSVGYMASFAGAPDWLGRLALVVVGCLTVPAAGFIILGAMSGGGARSAIADGPRRAYGHWPTLAALALLTFGLAAAGPMPGLLLERHALGQITMLLPPEFAEYGLAIVRLVALLGGIIGVSMAGCLWAAAWRASGGKSPPVR